MDQIELLIYQAEEEIMQIHKKLQNCNNKFAFANPKVKPSKFIKE